MGFVRESLASAVIATFHVLQMAGGQQRPMISDMDRTSSCRSLQLCSPIHPDTCSSLQMQSFFTFCHRTIRMIREMTVRTSRARMTEMMTTLNGKATTISTGSAVRLPALQSQGDPGKGVISTGGSLLL